MHLVVVIAADTRLSAVEACVLAFADAIDQAEQAGHVVDTVIVDSSDDDGVAEWLLGVEGARHLRAPRATRACALALGASTVAADAAWISGTDARPQGAALVRLAEALHGGAALAVADRAAPAPYALVSRPALPRLQALASADEHVDLVPALVEDLAGSGSRVAAVADAGVVRRRQREARPIDGGTPIGVDAGCFTVGPASYSGPASFFRTYGPLDRIEVGGYCSIADEVRLLLPGVRVFDPSGAEVLGLVQRGDHRPDSASSFPMGILAPEASYDVPPPGSTGEALVVGDDVWIGYRATVIGGVTIGTGAVIGTGSLVRSDVPPYAVVAGVPAKVVRMRFEEPTVERLLRLRWWDWDPAVVAGAHRWFSRPIEQFLRHFDPAGEIAPAAG